MTYAIGLYLVPDDIAFPKEDIDQIYDIVYGPESDKACLAETDFSGNNGYYFEEIFDVVLTNSEHCQFIGYKELDEARNRLAEATLTEYQQERVQPFIKAMEEAIGEGKQTFLYCD